jgi:hypothetical protein
MEKKETKKKKIINDEMTWFIPHFILSPQEQHQGVLAKGVSNPLSFWFRGRHSHIPWASRSHSMSLETGSYVIWSAQTQSQDLFSES